MFVQTEVTPNPNSLKFLPGKKVSNSGPYEITSKDKIQNELVRNILSVNGVEGIFLGQDFISVNKNDQTKWDDVKHIVISLINDFYSGGKEFVIDESKKEENLNLDDCKKLDVLPSSKEDLVKNSDFLSIHVQGGERYKDCITIKEMDKMKKTAFLINTSRGQIINEDDLIIALSTNEIAGAGLDVYEKEPLPENNKLRFLPNVLLTPHIGYVTAENYHIYYSQMIESLEACVNGKPIRVIE